MEKNIFCTTMGGWYMELNVKKMYPGLHRATIFNSLFQNIDFKKRISQITKLKYTCLKCPFFVAMLTGPLSFFVSDHDHEIKENSIHSNHKQKA